MRVLRTLTTAVAATTLAMAGAAATSAATAAPAATPDAGPAYDAQMLEVMASTFGTTTQQAAERLQTEQALGTAFAASGLATDGAFFSDGQLVVNVADAAAASAASAAGFVPRIVERGQADLDVLSAQVPTLLGADAAAVQSWGPDLESDTVVVTLDPSASSAVAERLAAIDGVSVETGHAQGLAPTADVVPGQIMDLDPGTNCSLGYPGHDSSGNNVMLTAGHCVEGLPDVLNASGTHIGVGVDTRFSTGSPSVDMGLMDIDDEDTGRGYVDTRMGTTVAISGMSKAPVGSAICKAGNTTGWTCGTIEGYGITVNYGGTVTSGLAEATVCTEGGDSGGAYISGSLAQGMTSGGPVGAECGFNGGDVGSYSFYQPVVDAANYYGVDITTS